MEKEQWSLNSMDREVGWGKEHVNEDLEESEVFAPKSYSFFRVQ